MNEERVVMNGISDTIHSIKESISCWLSVWLGLAWFGDINIDSDERMDSRFETNKEGDMNMNKIDLGARAAESGV